MTDQTSLGTDYRRQLVFACLLFAFIAGVIYDTGMIVRYEGLQAIVAAAVVACFGSVFLLTQYPLRIIQPALLASWPLHVYTICFVGVIWCMHGGSPKGTVIAYTIVAYATWLLVPVCLLLDRGLFDRFIKMVAIGCAVLAIPSYLGAVGIDYLLGIPLSNKYSYSTFSGIIASGGIFEHGEGHALQMAIGFFCCLYCWRKTRHGLYLVCTVMTVTGLAISQGRGAIFGVLIATAFFLAPELFRRSRPLFLGCLTVCLVFPFLIWPQLARIPGFSDYLRMERGLSGREVAWNYGVELFEERPWTGHGFGSSGDLTEDARKQLRKSGYSGAGTTFHNTFLTKAVELGLIVTLAYSLMYVVPLLRICQPSDDLDRQYLIRSVVLLCLTASIFRDYNIGGVRSTSILVAVFLGLANFWPLATEFSRQAIAVDETRPERFASTVGSRRLPKSSGQVGS